MAQETGFLRTDRGASTGLFLIPSILPKKGFHFSAQPNAPDHLSGDHKHGVVRFLGVLGVRPLHLLY